MTRALWLAAGLALVSGPPPPFATTVVDPQGSGDCKAVADIDLDGDADPVLGGFSLAWYESGAGWARREIRGAPVHQEFSTDMQAADLDGDGDPDLVLGDGGGAGNVLWFENPRLSPPGGKGNNPRVGSNWVHHVIGTHGDWTHDVEVADVDRDGRLDVLTSGHGRAHLFVRSGTGWAHRDLSDEAGAGVSLGDVDRDGRVDIAVPGAWLRAPANPLLGPFTRYPVAPAPEGDEVLLVDLDGDRRLDLVECDAHSARELAWYQAPRDPRQPGWTRRVIDPAMGSHHPEAADFDGDGRADLLMGLELQDLSIYWNRKGSPPAFQKQRLDTAAAHNARAGDLDGDGDPDVFGVDWIGHAPAKVHLNPRPRRTLRRRLPR